MFDKTTKEIKEIIRLAGETAEGIVNLKEKKKKLRKIGKARMQLQALSPEELSIMEENLQAREMFTQQGIKNLYMVICNAAVHDYKHARRRLPVCRDREEKEKLKSEINEIEQFFGDDFFQNVTGMRSKKKTIDAITNVMRKEARRKISL